MTKVFIEFKYIVNDKEFRFQIEPNCPINSAKAAMELLDNDLNSIVENSKQEQPPEETLKEEG